MTSALLIWLALVVLVTLALVVGRRIVPTGAWNLVTIAAVLSLAAALLVEGGLDRERDRQLLRVRLGGVITTPDGARVDVFVWGRDATVVARRLAAPPAGQAYRVWFDDASGAPLAAVDLSQSSAITDVYDRSELTRAATVRLVVESAQAGSSLGSSSLIDRSRH